MLYHCLFCGKPFSASPAARRKFCSHSCHDQSRDKHTARICERCGKVFLARHDKILEGQARYCSRTCANGSWKESCGQCGKPVLRRPSHAERFENIFCSRECYGLWKRNRISRICPQCGKSYETKRTKNIAYCSQACYDAARSQKLIELTCEQCGSSFQLPASAVGPSMYQGRYCSYQCSGEARRMPDNWRSEYNHEFTEALKESIRARDNHTCQMCGVHQSQLPRALDVHHISTDKTDNLPSNLKSLCNSCHSTVTIYATLGKS